MKVKSIYFLVIILSVFTLCLTASAQTKSSCIINVCFDTPGTEGFTGENGTVNAVKDSLADSGNYSLSITGTGASAVIDIKDSVVRNRTYNISFKVRSAQNSSGVTLKIRRKTSSMSEAEVYEAVSSGYLESGKWETINFTYENTYTGLGLDQLDLIVASDDLQRFFIDTFTVTDVYNTDESGVTAYESNIPSLAEAYSKYFPIGCFANDINVFSDSAESRWLTHHFSMVEPNNYLKLAFIRPTSGDYDFSKTDNFIQNAVLNGKDVHGHVLIWHSRSCTPDWLFKWDPNLPQTEENTIDREEALKRMRYHITTVMTRYKGIIKTWDVVNEAIDDTTGKLRDSYDDNGEERPHYWHNIIGDDYIEKAFEYAHEADPDAELYYNDYGKSNGKKWDAIYELVKGLREKGIDVNIGMQTHLSLTTRITGDTIDYPDYKLSSLEAQIKRFSELGCKIHISEVDVSGCTGLPPSVELDKQLTDKYVELFELLKKYKDVISGVTFWGATDEAPHMDADQNPGIFDKEGRAKNAFWSIIALADDTVFDASLTSGLKTSVLNVKAANFTDKPIEYSALISQFDSDGRFTGLKTEKRTLPAFNGFDNHTEINLLTEQNDNYFSKGMIWENSIQKPLIPAIMKSSDSVKTITALSTGTVRGGIYSDDVLQTTDLTVKKAYPDYLREGLMEFDLSNLSSCSKAILRYYVSSADTMDISLHSCSDAYPWDINSLTYNNSPLTSVIYRVKETISDAGYYETDITSCVKNSTNKYMTIRFKGLTDEKYIEISGYDSSNPPELIIYE
jgi:endo-1,4-beta-xylanase